MCGRSDSEGVEVAVPGKVGRPELVRTEEVVEKNFAESSELLEAVPVTGVGDGQIEKLQPSTEGVRGVLRPPFLGPAYRSLDLAPDVRKLFDERERLPPAAGKFAVNRAHSRTPKRAAASDRSSPRVMLVSTSFMGRM